MGLFNRKKEKKDQSALQGENTVISAKEELIEEEKNDMIQGVEELHETSVKEVMVPRIDVDFISIDTKEDDLLKKICESGHSRFPVFSDSIDNVLGILYVKDLIKVYANHETVDLNKIIRKAYFVPESKKIDSLLREFKRRHVHIAVVIDEYGGISGIVCMEDIIEEIVGDIQDEFDRERADILPLSENVWLCDARVDLDDMNESLNADFPSQEFDTLGGFVFDLFGKIPLRFEKVTWKNFDFIVQEMEGHKVNLIKVVKRNSE